MRMGKIRRSSSEGDKLESRATKLKSAAPIAKIWRASIVSGIGYVNKNKYRYCHAKGTNITQYKISRSSCRPMTVEQSMARLADYLF